MDPIARRAGERWGNEIDRGLAAGRHEVDITADTTRARAEIDRLLRDRDATIEVDADTARARAQLDLLTRDRRMTVTVDMDRSLSSLLSQLGQVSGAAGSASGGLSGMTSGLSALGGNATGTGAALVALIPVITALASAASAAAPALLLIPGALSTIAVGAGTLMLGLHGISDAFSAVSKASDTFAADQKSHASAVASATRALTSAVNSEASAQRDVARARRDAGRELEDLNDKLRDGTLNEAQAQLDLEKARERLSTGMFETSTDYKQAQLDVLQAEQRVIEAHKGNTRIQQEAVDARAKGVEGNEGVIAANDRLAAAISAATAAQERLAEATAATSASAKAANDAMAQLSPNAQAFVHILEGIKPVWDEMIRSIQESLFGTFGPALANLANTLIPAITPALQQIASAIGITFSEITGYLTDPGTVEGITMFLNNIADGLSALSPAMGALTGIFLDLAEVGAEFLPDLLGAFAGTLKDLAKTVADLHASGDLKKWIQGALDVFSTLAPILPAIISAFASLAPYGQILAETLTRMVVAAAKLFEALAPITAFVSAGIMGWLAVQMEALTQGIDLAVRAFNWMKTVIDAIPGAVNALWDAFKNRFPGIATLVETTVSTIKGAFKGVWDYLKEIWTWVENRVLPDWVKTLIHAFTGNTVSGQAVPAPAPTLDIPPGNPSPASPSPAPPAGPSPAAPPGTPPVVSTPYGDVTVPIVQKPDGTWTSTNAEWAKLITRESGGNPTITQGNIGDANNASGDLGLGLFQITTATWVANGGSQFAPNAKSATPQQQAIVAARIFMARGGQPWGAVPGGGREDEAGLRAGLTTGGGAPVAGGNAAVLAGTVPVFVTNWPGSSVVGPALPGGAVPAISATGPPNNAAVNAAGAALSAQFPGKKFNLGGSRAPGENASDAGLKRPDHLSGNALDIGIGSDMALGDAVKAWAEANKTALGIDYIMWRVAGHYDHVHLSFKPGFTPTVAGMPGAPGTTPVVAQQAVPPGATPVPASPSDPTYVNLDPNVPADQRAKAKESGKNGAEQLGKDLVAGIAEAFGFDGTLFKNPAEFGLVKIFAALSKVKPKEGKKNSTTGEPTVVGPGVGGDGGGGGLVDAALGLIPNIPRDDHLNPATAGPGPGNNGQGTVVNNNVDMSNSSYGYQPTVVGDQIREGQLRNSRSNLSNLPS